MTLRDIPIFPTAVVLAAAAIMIALGVWQLGRSDEKEALLAQFSRNASTDVVRDIAEITPSDNLYSRVRLDCPDPSDWNAVAGRNANGQTGYVHRYVCGTFVGLDTQGEQYASLLIGEIGWSPGPQRPVFSGRQIVGKIAAVGDDYKIVAEEGLAGLQASAQPDPNNVPNNHLAYAGQWFFFALTALVIYTLALRSRIAKRNRASGKRHGRPS